MSPLDSPLHQQKKSFLKTLFSPCSMLLLLLEACSLTTKPGWGYFFREIRWSYNGNGAKKCTKGKKVVKTIKWLFSRIFFSLLFFFFEVDTPTYKAGRLSMSVQGQIKVVKEKVSTWLSRPWLNHTPLTYKCRAESSETT